MAKDQLDKKNEYEERPSEGVEEIPEDAEIVVPKDFMKKVNERLRKEGL